MTKLKRGLVMVIIVIAAYLLQYGVFGTLPFIDTVPNVMLVVTISFAMFRGKNTGMLTGMLCGFVVDAASLSLLGYHMVIYTILGYICGFLHGVLYAEHISIPLLAAGICSFLYGCYCYIFDFLVRNRLNIGFYMKKIILPETLYTVVVMAFLYKLLEYVNKKLEESEKRRAAKVVR